MKHQIKIFIWIHQVQLLHLANGKFSVIIFETATTKYCKDSKTTSGETNAIAWMVEASVVFVSWKDFWDPLSNVFINYTVMLRYLCMHQSGVPINMFLVLTVQCWNSYRDNNTWNKKRESNETHTMKMQLKRVNFAFAQTYSQTDMSTLKKFKQRL